MKRRLFFILDRLKISRAERYSITALIALLVLLAALNALISPSSAFDDAYYSEMDEVFAERSARLQYEKQLLLARYDPAYSGDTLPEPPVPADRKVNINTADEAQLQKLPGIGPSYAARIIEYREQHGAFLDADALIEVRGIGQARLDKLRAWILVGPTDSSQTGTGQEASEHWERGQRMDQPAPTGTMETAAEKIDLNHATSEELQRLPGVGPAYAERIIAYRREHEGFRDVNELLKIKGIGEKRLAKIKPFVKLTGQH